MNKVFAIMFASLLLVTGTAQAHCGKCGVGDTDAPKADFDAMAKEKAEKLTQELKLTDEQKTQVQAIVKDKLAKKQALMDEKHKAMDALHEEFKTKLGAVLNPEQMKSWETMKSDPDNMKEKCPMCKDGKMCEMCAMKKGKNGDKDEPSHGDHGHDHGDDKK